MQLVVDHVELVLLGVNQASQFVDGNEVSTDLGIEVMDVVSERVDSNSQRVADVGPVSVVVNPCVLSGSVVSDSDVQSVESDSVSVDGKSVSVVCDVVVSNPVSLVVDLNLEGVDLMSIDMNGMELVLEVMSESNQGMSVSDDEGSEMVNLVGVNLDGSSVNNDLVSEGVDLSGVSVHSVSVLHDLLLFSFTIQLSGLGN